MRLSSPASARALPRLVASVVGLLLGCQQVFGDFEVSHDPEPPPLAETGGTGGGSSSGGQPSNPETCLPHERFCEEAVLHRCVDGRWEQTTCSSAARCHVSTAGCRTCLLGETQCLDDKTPQICDTDNDVWMTLPPCGVGQTCDQARGVCVACDLEDGVCINENVICRCKADQSGFEPLTCPGGCSMMGTGDRCAGGQGMAGGPAGICDNI